MQVPPGLENPDVRISRQLLLEARQSARKTVDEGSDIELTSAPVVESETSSIQEELEDAPSPAGDVSCHDEPLIVTPIPRVLDEDLRTPEQTEKYEIGTPLSRRATGTRVVVLESPESVGKKCILTQALTS